MFNLLKKKNLLHERVLFRRVHELSCLMWLLCGEWHLGAKVGSGRAEQRRDDSGENKWTDMPD